jgi:hypothetical protein
MDVCQFPAGKKRKEGCFMKKQFLTGLLSLSLVLSLVPNAAWASAADAVVSEDEVWVESDDSMNAGLDESSEFFDKLAESQEVPDTFADRIGIIDESTAEAGLYAASDDEDDLDDEDEDDEDDGDDEEDNSSQNLYYRDLSNSVYVSFSPYMQYTGKAIKPTVSVYVKGTKIASKYYSVKYYDNVNVGTATVVVTVSDKVVSYTGNNGHNSTEATFTIVKDSTLVLDLKDTSVNYGSFAWNDLSKVLKGTVKYNGKTVKDGDIFWSLPDDVDAGTYATFVWGYSATAGCYGYTVVVVTVKPVNITMKTTKPASIPLSEAIELDYEDIKDIVLENIKFTSKVGFRYWVDVDSVSDLTTTGTKKISFTVTTNGNVAFSGKTTKTGTITLKVVKG